MSAAPSIAILGCGRMGRIRAAAAAQIGARVALVFDPDAERAREVAEASPGCRAAQSLDEIRWADFDAAFVCTPPGLHIEVALAAASAGAALFIEKPLSVSAAAAEPLIRRQREHPFVAAVGFMNRLRPSVRLLREKIAHGGAPLVSAFWSNAAYKVPWWTDEGLSGGPFREQAAHFVDLLTYLLGPVESVRGLVGDGPEGGYGHRAVACLGFESGALATLAYGAHAKDKTIGIQFFTADETWSLQSWSLDLVNGAGEVVAADGPDRNAIFVEETRLFLEAAAEGSAPPLLCTLEEAYATQRTIDRIAESFDGG